MQQYTIIGDPIDHSLSPVIYNTLYPAYGLDCRYSRTQVSPGDLPQFIEAVHSTPILGFNVTMPLKKEIIQYLDEVHPFAAMAQAVNIVVNQGGKLIGYNVDGTGLCEGLVQNGIPIQGKHITVLGAGGASVSICLSLAHYQAGCIDIVNRTLPKAQQIAQLVSQNYSCDCHTYEMQGDISPLLAHTDIIINTTSLGMHGIAQDWENLSFLDALPKGAAAIDIIYNPSKTTFLLEAEKRGLTIQNGLEMLIYQGFESFALYHQIQNHKEDYALLKSALTKALGQE